MVRFVRLTSWRSLDLLEEESEIPESPPSFKVLPISNYEVRGLPCDEMVPFLADFVKMSNNML